MARCDPLGHCSSARADPGDVTFRGYGHNWFSARIISRNCRALSFLLAIPAIAGAGQLTTIDSIQNGLDVEMLPLIVGFLSAMFSGLLAIRLFLYVAKHASLMSFAVYRVFVGILILWWFM
ncbi:MAG: hypothetical protein IPG80_03495 [Anaerolineales bacterium]|nr:hypothetical protein [Anaerolineales bacterium]